MLPLSPSQKELSGFTHLLLLVTFFFLNTSISPPACSWQYSGLDWPGIPHVSTWILLFFPAVWPLYDAACVSTDLKSPDSDSAQTRSPTAQFCVIFPNVCYLVAPRQVSLSSQNATVYLYLLIFKAPLLHMFHVKMQLLLVLRHSMLFPSCIMTWKTAFALDKIQHPKYHCNSFVNSLIFIWLKNAMMFGA